MRGRVKWHCFTGVLVLGATCELKRGPSRGFGGEISPHANPPACGGHPCVSPAVFGLGWMAQSCCAHAGPELRSCPWPVSCHTFPVL